jgi:hypothetical protein
VLRVALDEGRTATAATAGTHRSGTSTAAAIVATPAATTSCAFAALINSAAGAAGTD